MNAPSSLNGDWVDRPSSPIPIPTLTPASSPDEGEPWLAESNRKPFQATPRKWLVHNLVRDIQRGGSVWGLPGQGKGLVMVFLSLCLLYGIDINGKRTRRVEKVLYIDAEDDLDEFANRVTGLHTGLCELVGEKFPPVDPNRLVYMNVTTACTADARALLREAIRQQEPDVVIYDALQSLFGGNQSTGEVGSDVWHWIQRTAIECGHVPLAVDHCGWQARHELGSVHKRGRVGQSLQVVKRAGQERVLADGSEYQVIDVYLRKSNYQVGGEGAPVLSLACTFKRGPCLLQGAHEEPDDCIGATSIEYLEPSATAGNTVSAVVAILEAQGETPEADLAATLGKSTDAVRKAIDREQKRGNPEAKRLAAKRNPKRWFLVS